MWGRLTVKRSRPSRWGMTILGFAFMISAAVYGALMLQKYEQRRNPPPVPPQAQESGTMLVTLFFAAADGSGLVREGREMDACGEPEECIGDIIQELAGGPLGDLAPTLPNVTTVRDVQVTGDLATVDLGREFVEALPAGSSAEMTAVYSIIDTIAVNFPQIRRVSFLVEGKPVRTFTGHLDLRQPLAPDFSLERKADISPSAK